MNSKKKMKVDKRKLQAIKKGFSFSGRMQKLKDRLMGKEKKEG